MKFLQVIALTIVAGAGISLLFTARTGVESDLFALMDSAASGSELKSAAAAMSKSARFIVKADSEDAANARLAELGVFDAISRPSTSKPQHAALLQSLAPYARGFLSPATRELLEHGEFGAVRDAAVARLFSPMPPVLPPSADPFLLFTDYVMELSAPKDGWVVVNMSLTPNEALAAFDAVKVAEDIRCAGAPFHTAIASERSKREINVLSCVSLFCVILFGWLLTRSFRFVPALIAQLAAAFCVAAAVLFAAFPRPHLMTFVFGTTLIGLGVDYVYHALAARGSIAKPLTFSFLSTAACFLPLFISKVGVLNQMALFTVSGLSTIYAGVMLFMHPCGCASVDSPRPMWRRFPVFAAMAIMLGLFGVSRLHISNDLSGCYKSDPMLAEGERMAATISGASSSLPSADEQRHCAALVRRLYAEEGARYLQMTGLPPAVLGLPDEDAVFDPKAELVGMFNGWSRDACLFLGLLVLMLMVACVILLFLKGVKSCGLVLPVLLSALATFGLLGLTGTPVNFFHLLCFFIFIGLGLDYSIFHWHAGGAPTEESTHGNTARAVRYSFLTSFVGFGLLAFTSFAVTRSMGMTLAAGLAFAYLVGREFSLFCRCGRAAAEEPLETSWHMQREQCASRFWAQFMWCSYAWFGKTFQKTIFVIGMPVIYVFSKPARMALTQFYCILSEYTGRPFDATHGRLFRHILGFAWGVMDKTDACTLAKKPPQMTVRNDEGWRAFRELVDAGQGAFIICTHVGTIGVLPALPDALGTHRSTKVHAFQQMSHDAVFMNVFMKHFDDSRLVLHAVEDIGVETAVEMQDAIRRGELVIMAGDRTSAGSKSVLRRRFLGKDCLWPKGTFKFAELMEAPVFGITCVRTGWNRYEVHVAELGAKESRPEPRSRKVNSLLSDYVTFLESETMTHPEQWYQFYDFFSGCVADGRLAREMPPGQ